MFLNHITVKELNSHMIDDTFRITVYQDWFIFRYTRNHIFTGNLIVNLYIRQLAHYFRQQLIATLYLRFY